MTPQQFYTTYAPLAKAVTQGTKVFPGVVLAVAALESANGNSKLTKEANNFFGIKAFSSWTGAKYRIQTKEVIDGKETTVWADFRKYFSPDDSFADYVKLLHTARYANALKATTPTAQIEAIKAAGYSTDPTYITKVESIINQIKQFANDVKKKQVLDPQEHCLQSLFWSLSAGSLNGEIKLA